MKGRNCLAAVAFASFFVFSLALAQAAPVAQIGTFRPGTGQWFLDFSGNRAWDRCGPDGCLVQFGSPGDRPVIGDWAGDGVPRIGVFRPATGQWFLDRNGNGFWDGCGTDRCLDQFGASIDRPVAGDWTGTGTVRAGVFRPATGQWFLDLNGNGLWDGCGTDRCLQQFGSPTDLPVAGDIDADGLAEVGVYRPATGQWFFDRNNNGLWDGCGIEMCLTQFGASGDLPLLADMNGDGSPEVGVFRPASGQWFFDLDHSGAWSGCGLDGCFGPFGASVDLPVTGAWDPLAGPGDPLNYFPISQGSTWTFQGTSIEDGIFTGNYQNTVTVSGTRLIDGITTTVISESNPENSGPIEQYFLKDGRGITNWGNNDPSDTITPRVVAFQEALFPLRAGTSFMQYQKSDLDLGEDLDGDWFHERVAISSRVAVAGFETVSVPAGTFPDSARIVNTLELLVTLTSSPSTPVTGTVTTTSWYAPGVGPIKREIATRLFIDDQAFSSMATEVLTSFLVAPSLLPIALPTNDIIYNPVIQRIYASVPGRAGANGNSVAVIEPATTTVESFIPVGSEPGKLALSDDGRYLYVALDGTAAISRIDFLNPAAPVIDLQFSLGSDPFAGPFYVEDMEVLPGTPHAIAVSRMYPFSSPRHAGVAIYDDGVPRSVATPGHTGSNVIEFSATSSVLYGYNNETTDFGFRRMAVDASGVSVTDVYANLITGFAQDIEFAGGLVYATSGQVVNPETGTLAGTFPVAPFGSLVEPDATSGRVFFLSSGISPGGGFTLRAFDRNTFLPLGEVDVDGVSGNPGSLIRWGTNGLAFRSSGDQLFVFTTSLIP